MEAPVTNIRKSEKPARADAKILAEAIAAFAELSSEQHGVAVEVCRWPGGDKHRHDADALLIVGQGTGTRVLLEVTRCLQGPTEHYGSLAFRLEDAWRELERTIAAAIPRDCSLTIYWREEAHDLMAQPIRDTRRKGFLLDLPPALAGIVSAARWSTQSITLTADAVPTSLQPLVTAIAVITGVHGEVTFRFPLHRADNSIAYSAVPLGSVGVGPSDMSDAIMPKLATLPRYRKSGIVHRADQVWLLLMVDGESAASILSVLSFLGAIPDRIPALKVRPNFDAIYLAARGEWSRPTHPLEQTRGWLFIRLSPEKECFPGLFT